MTLLSLGNIRFGYLWRLFVDRLSNSSLFINHLLIIMLTRAPKSEGGKSPTLKPVTLLSLDSAANQCTRGGSVRGRIP